MRTSLDMLCSYLDQLYDINSGGCCYVAYLIAAHLDKIGINYSLAIYNDSSKNIVNITQEVVSMIKSNSYESVVGNQTCDHYCLSIVGGGYVNKGDVVGLKKHLVKGITCKNIKWIYRNGFWNDQYDTNNNRNIKRLIDSFFRKYE